MPHFASGSQERQDRQIGLLQSMHSGLA
jgi:hypothetical protein